MPQDLFYSSTAVQMQLTAPMGSGDTTCALNTTTGLPVSFPFKLLIDWGAATQEVVYVTGLTGLTPTIVRGQDGTTAQAHSVGAVVVHGVSAGEFNDLQSHIAADTGVHGVTGNVVGTTDTQALTNKTIDGNDNDLTVLQDQIAGAPLGPFVGTTDIQTLTNKALTAPSVNGGTLDGCDITDATIDDASTIGGISGTTIATLPRGAVASAFYNSLTFSTGTDFATAAATFLNGRRYRITYSVLSQVSSSPAFTITPSFASKTGSGTYTAAWLSAYDGDTSEGAGFTVVWEFVVSGGDFTGTPTFTHVSSSGSDTFKFGRITVEDIGV